MSLLLTGHRFGARIAGMGRVLSFDRQQHVAVHVRVPDRERYWDRRQQHRLLPRADRGHWLFDGSAVDSLVL